MQTLDFIESIFGDREGYLYISLKHDDTQAGITNHKAFKYPAQKNQIVDYVTAHENEDVYFSPMLYSVPRRVKKQVKHTPVIYADTDMFPVENFLIPPSLNVETSPGRHASFWILDDDYEPSTVEAVARALSLTHASKDAKGNQAGVDPGGWDLSQLLRMPNAKNLKYKVLDDEGKAKYPEYTEEYSTSVDSGDGTIYSLEEIAAAYNGAKILSEVKVENPTDIPYPTELPPTTPVLARVYNNTRLLTMYEHEPFGGQDWSDLMYAFVSEMLRNRFTPEETLVVAWNAPFNKFKRDHRPMSDLWQYDIAKAVLDPENTPREILDIEAAEPEPVAAPIIKRVARPIAQELRERYMTEEELGSLRETFVDRYVKWALSRSPDSPAVYHIANAFTVMSCIFGEWGQLDLQFESSVRLGLFIVIMGETTKTRKTTSKNLMKDLLRSAQTGGYKYMLSSDITPETLIDRLAERPFRSSMYDHDEAQELIEGIKGGKGYLKGLFTTFNKLYDGWAEARDRKDKSTPETPVVFIQYLMGIRSQIQDALEVSDFASGWGPRNLYVNGTVPEGDGKRKRMSKPKGRGEGKPRTEMIRLTMELTKARDYWKGRAGDVETPEYIEFSDEAWERMEDFADAMDEYVQDNPRYEILSPAVDRLDKNLKKVAALLAMSEQRDEVSMHDALTVIYYGTQWAEDLIQMVDGVADSALQRDLDSLLALIESGGGVIKYRAAVKWATRRGTGLRVFRELVETLVDSGIIVVADDKEQDKCLKLV